IPYGAVGAVGGGLCDVVFVLSQDDQYKVSMVTSLYLGPNDFLDLSNDGRFYFLYTTFFGLGEEVRAKDGKHHNYWVYAVISVDGSTLKWNNSSIPGFPKWVFFSFRPNHEETDQFTNEQKNRFFDPEQSCLISTTDHPCPGYFKRY